MFHKVKNVTPLNSYMLSIIFETSEMKIYNVKQLFDKHEEFRILSQVIGLFNQVKVEQGGYAISWNNELDISCNELYENGISYSGFSDKDIYGNNSIK